MTGSAPAAEQVGRELPNYTRERSSARPVALLSLVIGSNAVTMVLRSIATADHADPALVVLLVVCAAAGVLSLVMAAVSLFAPPPRAWLTGTSLVTASRFARRSVDLATARLAVSRHALIAADPVARRAARLPVVGPRTALPPADLVALADTIRAAAHSNPAPRQASLVADHLRELATDDVLRRELTRRMRTQHVVGTVVVGILIAIAALALGAQFVSAGAA